MPTLCFSEHRNRWYLDVGTIFVVMSAHWYNPVRNMKCGKNSWNHFSQIKLQKYVNWCDNALLFAWQARINGFGISFNGEGQMPNMYLFEIAFLF